MGAAALIIALGGAAAAAIPDSGATLHGCSHRTTGSLRLVESAGECRSNERAVDWARDGGGGADVRSLERVTIGDGETRLLFEEAPFTITVNCEVDVPVLGTTVKDVAQILLTTSEEDTAPDFPVGQPQQIHEVGSVHSGDHHSNYGARNFSVSAPSGVDLSGYLYAGTNSLGQPETCTFGGYVVVGSEVAVSPPSA